MIHRLTNGSMRRRFAAAACALLSWTAGPAQAGTPANSITLTDGNVSFTLNGLIGQRLTANGGLANLVTQAGPTPVDHMFQYFIWYRGAGDTREYALSNQLTFEQWDDNRGTALYHEPVGNGSVANALQFLVTFQLINLSALPDRPNAVLRMEIWVKNNTLAPMTFRVFAYSDMDLGGTSSDDSAVAGSQFSRNSQSLLDSNPHTMANFTASRDMYGSQPNFGGFEIGTFPALRNKLTDANADVLSDGVFTISNTDCTTGYEWVKTSLPAGEYLFVSSQIQLNTLPCPADIDRSGNIDINDLLEIINGWGGCP